MHPIPVPIEKKAWVKGVADRCQIGELGCIPAQQEGPVALTGSLQAGRPDRQGNQQHKQQGQTPARQSFNATAHPCGHHSTGDRQAE